MSITVEDCLKLPSLKEARVVSGHKGLPRIVSSVSVLEYAETKILSNSQIFRVNEIILSAFASIRDDVKAQCRTLDLLNESGNVALILYYVGYFIKKLDQQLLDKSEELDFPIIVMPINRIDLPYNEAIGEIMESIFLDRYHETRFVNSMLERISRLPDRQRTLRNIMQMLGERLKCTLLLTDETLRAVNFTKRSVSHWLTEDILIILFAGTPLDGGIDFAELLCSDSATVYRISFLHDQKKFYLIAADDTGQLTREDLQSAAELLEVSSSIWKYKLDTDYLDALLPALLSDNKQRASQLAETFHIRLESLSTMGIVHLTDHQLSFFDRQQKYEHLSSRLVAVLSEFGQPPLANICGELLVFVVGEMETTDEQDLLSQVYQSMAEEEDNLLMTVFQHSGHRSMAADFFQYCQNIDSVQQIYPLTRNFSAHHVRFAADCASESSHSQVDPCQLLAPLKGHHDEEDLISTLSTFLLDADNDTKKTGEIMFLHRNTVQFRLNKIKDRLRADITQLPESYTYYKACAMRRLAAIHNT